MISQEDASIQTFVKLGLTYLQAKVYITLLKLGNNGADVRKTSHTSAIARQDIYRILPALEKLGLVEKIIAMPTLYKPIELEEAVSILMKKRTEEFLEIQKSAKSVLDTFVAQQTDGNDSHSEFRITSEEPFL